MKKKPPAFQFYPDEFLGSTNVALMTDAEIGVYVRLLCYEWNGPGLPTTNPDELAAMLRIKPSVFAVMWKRIGPCFVEREGRLFNQRLDRERQKQQAFRTRQTEKVNHRWEMERKRRGTTPEVPGNKSGNTLQSLSLSNNNSGAVVSERDGAENGAPTPPPAVTPYLVQCVVALNEGLRDNPRLKGMRFEVSTATQTNKVRWEADQIPLSVAESVVRQVARDFTPNGKNKRINSLLYFDAPVRDQWAQLQAQGVTAKDKDPVRVAWLLKNGYAVPLPQ